MESKIIRKLKNLSIPFLVTALGTIGGLFIVHEYQQEELFKKFANPICQRVMKRFDENKDGILENQEGINLANALGYSGSLPLDNPITFHLMPVRDFCRNLIELEMQSPYNITRDGLSSREFYFPLSKLEQLAKEKTSNQ